MNKEDIVERPKFIEKECKHHGLTTFVWNNAKRNSCYVCQACKTQWSVNSKRKAKQFLVEYKGGCCEKCGYNKCLSALEFHHIDPSIKDFELGKTQTRNLNILKKEADKCLLVCANCHREIHAEEYKFS